MRGKLHLKEKKLLSANQKRRTYFKLALIITLTFNAQILSSQENVSNNINKILKELISQSNDIDSLISLHDSKKPNLEREKLKTKYDSIVNVIIDKRYQQGDSIFVYNTRNDLLNELTELTKWETEKASLLNKKQNISKQITQYSAIIDLSKSTESLRNQINKAKAYKAVYDRDVTVSFATSVREIKERVYSEFAYNSLSESMIIFEPGTNEKSLDWLKNGMNILGIAGGVTAYSGFDNNDKVTGFSSIAATSLIYLIGQKIITKRKNKDSELQRSLEALSRNVLYGNIIREDSTNLAKLKISLDSLHSSIKYLPRSDPREIEEDWQPSEKVIEQGHLVLSYMKNSLVFWNKIVLASKDMLTNTANFLTKDGTTNLTRNISKAQSLISVREDNISRFRSKLYYLEKLFSENVERVN